MQTNIYLHNSADHDDAQRTGGNAAIRKAHVVDATPFDTLGTLARKAYGLNTAENRYKIAHANTDLTSFIVAPR